MSTLKTSLQSVTNEEIDRASALWQCGEPFKVIAYKVGWTETLFWRVAKLCRKLDDPKDRHFPARNKKSFKVRNKEQGDGAALDAAKKPVTLSRAAWKAALSTNGFKPSTVKARRPSDYLVKRKLVDPTLCLPGAS